MVLLLMRAPVRVVQYWLYHRNIFPLMSDYSVLQVRVILPAKLLQGGTVEMCQKTIDSAKLLANALVLPYFDYCCTSAPHGQIVIKVFGYTD